MARDILSEYGPDASGPQKARANTGGIKEARDVNAYRTPQGPSSIDNPQSPGLHGNVYPSGSQTTSIHGGQSGSPGLGGTKRKSGSQR